MSETTAAAPVPPAPTPTKDEMAPIPPPKDPVVTAPAPPPQEAPKAESASANPMAQPPAETASEVKLEEPPKVDYAKPTNVSASNRREELNALGVFESKRNGFFVDQHQKNSMYWSSLGELIRENDESTEQVMQFLANKVEADRAHATRLYTLFDIIDGVKKGACQNRCDKQREAAAKGRKASVDRSSKKVAVAAAGEKGPREPNSTMVALMEVAELDCSFAKALDDLADGIDADFIHGKLQAMAKETHNKFHDYIAEGNMCLKTLHNIDHHTHHAYTNVQEAMGENLQVGEHSHMTDVWLLDMQYRVAVRQQNDAWKEVSTTLRTLFDKMKELEVRRRTDLRDAMLEVVNRTSTMWHGLPKHRDTALPIISSMDANPLSVTKEIDAKTVEGVKKMTDSEKLTMDNGEIPKNDDFIKELKEPLVSPLVRTVVVMERKDPGVISSKYIPGLLVLTWDGWLHFFDLPKGSKLNLDTPPGVVFQELAPDIDVNVFKLTKKGEEKVEVKVALSLELDGESAVEMLHGKKSHKFEVTGLKKNSSIKAAFGSSHKHKSVTMRCTTESLMMDVATKIQAAAEGAGEGAEPQIREKLSKQ